MKNEMDDVDRTLAAWKRIKGWLGTHFQDGLALLSTGATVAELSELEETIGRALPDCWRRLLLENNGQVIEDDPGLFGGWSFLSTKLIAREWKNWTSIRAKAQPSLLYGARFTAEPPDAIEETYTDNGWIPIAKEPMEGNYIGLDYNPGPAGQSGQVINFGRDEDEKHVLAPAFPDLLEWLASAYEAGRITIERVDDRYVASCDNERLTIVLTEDRAARLGNR